MEVSIYEIICFSLRGLHINKELEIKIQGNLLKITLLCEQGTFNSSEMNEDFVPGPFLVSKYFHGIRLHPMIHNEDDCPTFVFEDADPMGIE